ncbi:MAG: hypothetical protein ACTSYI_11055 [Promethearchaeota archaeon]
MGVNILETEKKYSDLIFNSLFKKLNYYLGTLGIIMAVTLLIIFIENGQVRIWSLVAGGVGIIYLASQIIKYGDYDQIRFSKYGIFLEKSSSKMPKEVFLIEDLADIKLFIRKTRVQNDEDEGADKPEDEYRYWIDIVVIQLNGTQYHIDMRIFINEDDESLLPIAEGIKTYMEETYKRTIEIFHDTN